MQTKNAANTICGEQFVGILLPSLKNVIGSFLLYYMFFEIRVCGYHVGRDFRVRVPINSKKSFSIIRIYETFDDNPSKGIHLIFYTCKTEAM